MGGRKRKNFLINREQMKAFNDLKEMLQLDRIMNNTSVFEPPMDRGQNIKFDQETANQIKAEFTLWFNSWVKPNLDKL